MADYMKKATTITPPPPKSPSTNAQRLNVQPAPAQPVPSAQPAPLAQPAPPVAPAPVMPLISAQTTPTLTTPSNVNADESPITSPSNLIPIPTESVVVQTAANTTDVEKDKRRPLITPATVPGNVFPTESPKTFADPINVVHSSGDTTSDKYTSQKSRSNSESGVFVISKPVIIVAISAGVSILLILIIYKLLRRNTNNGRKNVNDEEKITYLKSFCPSYISDDIESMSNGNPPVSKLYNDTEVGYTPRIHASQSNSQNTSLSNDIYDATNSYISTNTYDTCPTTTEVSQFQFSMKSSQVFYPN